MVAFTSCNQQLIDEEFIKRYRWNLSNLTARHRAPFDVVLSDYGTVSGYEYAQDFV